MKKVNVKQQPNEEIAVDVLAKEIVEISESIRRLRSGKLKDKALYLLIQHSTGGVGHGYQKVPIAVIKAVFDGAENLAKDFLK